MNKQIIKIILWSALFTSNFIFIALAMNLTPAEATMVDTGPGLPVSYVLFIAGCISVLLSFIVPKFLRPAPEMQDPETTKFILGLALNESASIFAFIIAFIFHDYQLSYVLFGISIVGYLLKFPRGNAKASTGLDA